LKIICLIATYNHAPLLWDCLQHLDQLKPNFDKYIFFENNSEDNTLDVIKRFKRPKELMRMWFVNDAVKKLGNPYAMIGLVRQFLLEKARKINPDYAIFIDDDIILYDKDFISRITSWKKDICGAPYLRNYPEGTNLASIWKRKGYKGNWMKRCCKGFQECHLTSAGCMCLTRKIIQDKRFGFYPIIWGEIWGEKKKGFKASEDYGYCLKARAYGYKVYIDCTLRVGHYAEGYSYKPWFVKKDKKGNIIGNIDFEYGHGKKITKEILKGE